MQELDPVGSEQAGPGVAAIISIVETCRRLQITAREHLAPYSWLGELPANRVNGNNADGSGSPGNSRPIKPNSMHTKSNGSITFRARSGVLPERDRQCRFADSSGSD